MEFPSFAGPGAMVSFGAVGRDNGSGNSFYQSFEMQENGDEYLDDYFSQPEKKRRLSVHQVQFLERSFDVENKLEPERKLQLANELGLQPRQIAVWFQNRRARCKTKHLETEYETLHSSYKTLKMDYDYLLKENEKLKAEVMGNSFSKIDSNCYSCFPYAHICDVAIFLPGASPHTRRDGSRCGARELRRIVH